MSVVMMTGHVGAYLEHFERNTEQILVKDGRHGEHSQHGELLRVAASQKRLIQVS